MINASSALTLLFTLAALAVVLVLAWLLLKGLSSISPRGSSRNPLRVKASLPLGNRERLMVVEYRGSEYLLGVSTGGISLIDKHPAPDSKAVADEHPTLTKAYTRESQPH